MQRISKDKRRAHRKKVRTEKRRLWARAKKPRPKKWVLIELTGLEVETINKLRAYAKEHHISVNKAITKVLNKYREEYGIQK